MSNKTTLFKDSIGRWLTTGLFKETAQSRDFIIMTINEAREYYLAENDPTGYKFATKHLGGWKHWLALKGSPTLAGYIAEWEEELEVKLRSDGLEKIIDHAKAEKGYQAAKYLVEAGWKPKELGRPTRERIDKEARIRNKMYAEFKNDLRLDS